MNVNFHLPDTPALRNAVRAIFQTDGFPGFSNETILPKGCTEIIFDLSESPSINGRIGNSQGRLPRCFIYGYTQTPIYLQLSRQQTYFGIFFHPVIVKHILGIPAKEFANRWVDLTLIDPLFNTLWHRLAEQKEFASRVAVVRQWIEKKTSPLKGQEQKFNEFLSGSLYKMTTVPQVADELCYSPRQLSRKIQDITDMNTEDLLLYKKYLRAIELIHTSKLSLSGIAHESHFADQSHFIKSFKMFTNLTPGEYAQLRTTHLPGHIFHNVR